MIDIAALGLKDFEIAAFRELIRIDEDGCHLWTGGRDGDGHGRFGISRGDRRIQLATHRVALHLAGLDTGRRSQSCGNLLCCRPDHQVPAVSPIGGRFRPAREPDADGRFQCSNCGRMLLPVDFNRNPTNRWGFDYWCRKCMTAARIANPRRAIGTSRCGHCLRELPCEQFYRSRRARDGLSSWCKECHAVWQRERRAGSASKTGRADIEGAAS